MQKVPMDARVISGSFPPVVADALSELERLMPTSKILDMRMGAPADVIGNWRDTAFFTSDAIVHDHTGGVYVITDPGPIHHADLRIRTSPYAVGVVAGDLDGLASLEGALYLDAEQVEQVHGCGYIKKGACFVPHNDIVEVVWNHLAGDADLAAYANDVGRRLGDKEIMRVHLLGGEELTMQPLLIGRTKHFSNINGGSLRNDTMDSYPVVPLGEYARSP